MSRRWWHRAAASRAPDFVIGGAARPYIRRWWIVPRNRFFNIYLHEFLRSDDDRALHDHPWPNVSLLLEGSYIEHTIAAGGIHRRTRRSAGEWKFRRAIHAHRIEISEPCWTLFVTGPVIRRWGFHCPEAGWVPWQNFVAGHDPGDVGKGCAQ